MHQKEHSSSDGQSGPRKHVGAVAWQVDNVYEHVAWEMKQALGSKRAAQSRRFKDGNVAYFVSVKGGCIAVLVRAAENSSSAASIVDSPHAGASVG